MPPYFPQITRSDLTYSRYPQNLGQPPVDKWILFEAKSGHHVIRNRVIGEGAGNLDRTLAAVGLYMTETALSDVLQIDYNQADLGPFIGALIEKLAQTGHNLFNIKPGTNLKQQLQTTLDAVTAEGKRSFGEMKDNYAEMIKADVAKALENLAGLAGIQNTGGAVGALTGQKPNPRTDVQFEAQQYRVHQYEFTLIPRNVNEAQAIDRIVNFFQFYSLPSYRANDTTPAGEPQVGSFMMGFPYEFEITFLDGQGQVLNHVNRVGRSVLRNITVNHAAAGKTAFVKDNGEYYPVASHLTLQFQEVRLLGRDSEEIQRSQAIDPKDTNFDPRQ